MLRYIQVPKAFADAEIAHVSQENNVSVLMAELLLARGLSTREKIQAFLNPSIDQMHDPYLLPDMHEATERILSAIQGAEPICIYGDYDADGVCATAILLQYLKTCGAKVVSFVPSRHQEGYGMNENAVMRLAQQGIKLIITVDNGISAISETRLCQSLGMDVIVTDHHQCPAELPECIAVVNPHREDSQYPNKHLCGAGVALKLVHALGGIQSVMPYLPVAALATVADVVELKGENRAIVAAGLPLIQSHIGLNALLSVSGSVGQAVTSDMLAFRLAPRLNAAGRMGDPARALSLLVCENDAQAREFAHVLNDENEKRQAEEQRILRDARAMLQKKDVARLRAIMLYSADWNPGITGIVAAKLVEEYHRPVLLFHMQGEVLTGSCRSISGIHLFECLRVFEDSFLRYGGHAQAAGITMRMELFAAFCDRFNLYLTENIPPHVFLPTMRYEKEISLSALTIKDVECLHALAPYGEGNPQPIYRSGGVRLEDVTRMGRDDSHLRATVVQENRRVGLVAFGQGKKANEWSQGGIFDILYTAEINLWQESRRLQLMLRAAKSVTFFEDSSFIKQHDLKFYDAFFRNVLYNVSRNAVLTTVEDIDEFIAKSLINSVQGTLIVCATPQGMVRLRDLLAQRQLTDYIDIYWNRLPSVAGSGNSVLLAPFPGFTQACEFERVILFDSGEEWLFSITEASRVYVPLQDTFEEMLIPLKVSRDTMGHLYQAFCNRLKNGRVPRAVLLAEPVAQNRETALLALLTFIELGFFSWDEPTDTVTSLPDVKPKSLWDSCVYAAANRNDMAQIEPA